MDGNQGMTAFSLFCFIDLRDAISHTYPANPAMGGGGLAFYQMKKKEVRGR